MIPIPPYIPSWSPVPVVTPFTYRDGVTMLKKVDGIIRYLNRTIVPYINETNQELADKVEADINNMINVVNTAIASLEAETDTKLADMQTTVNNAIDYVNTSIANLTTYVDEQVQLIIQDGVQVQDPVMKGIMQNPASQTRIVTDALYQKSANLDNDVANNLANSASVTNAGVKNIVNLSKRGVSVREYGAKGDNATNDTTAITNAINAMSGIGGGSVYFPPGTYLTDAISLPANVTLYGDRIATLKARSAMPIFISINGVKAAISGIKIDGDNKVSSYLIDIATNSSDVLISNSELCNITGTGTIALVRARAGCDRLNIIGSYIHDCNASLIGRGILIGATTGGIVGVKIDDCFIEKVYPVADADGICVQDFPARIDVTISNTTFRNIAKRAIKAQSPGIKINTCDIDLGTTVTPAWCGIAIYASDVTVRGCMIRGVYAVDFIDIGAAGQALRNIHVIDNSVVGDPTTRQSSCDGIRAQADSITDATFNNNIYAIRNGYQFENIVKNVSISGIIDDAIQSAVIINDHNNGTPPSNIIVPWMVFNNVTNYGFHTNGGAAPTNIVIGAVSGIANFGKFGGNMAAGARTAFFEKNPIAKPTVTGSIGTDATFNSLVLQLVSLGLINDGRV